MSVHLQGRLRSARVVQVATTLLWAVVALSAVYWGLRWAEPQSSSAREVPPQGSALAGGPPVAGAPPDPRALARLLGAQAPTEGAPESLPGLAARLALTGVVAGTSGAGAALIAVDGAPPRPYRVGSPVTEGLVLQSVRQRGAVLAETMQAAPAVTLALPPLPEPVGLSDAGTAGTPGSPSRPRTDSPASPGKS